MPSRRRVLFMLKIDIMAQTDAFCSSSSVIERKREEKRKYMLPACSLQLCIIMRAFDFFTPPYYIVQQTIYIFFTQADWREKTVASVLLFVFMFCFNNNMLCSNNDDHRKNLLCSSYSFHGWAFRRLNFFAWLWEKTTKERACWQVVHWGWEKETKKLFKSWMIILLLCY